MDNGVDVSNAHAERVDGGVRVTMDLDFRNVKVKSNRSLQVIPSLAGTSDTLMIARLSVMGRNRILYYLRNKIEPAVSENDRAWTKKDLPDQYRFDVTLPYEKWMNGARIMVNECILGCCNKTLSDNWEDTKETYSQPVVPQFVPEFVYLRPHAEVHKMRELSAVSYVDFPVSQTTLYPDYRNNPEELKKIIQTIESVSNDKDITISRIGFKGFASPESPYENNYRLAKGRTATIKAYVSEMAGDMISSSILDVDFEPENWEGLAEYIEKSDISNKEGLLKIVHDYTLAPDAREWHLKKTYPTEYAYLLENCYPALRKVDYVIEYEVRVYTTVEEIRKAFAEDPSKLSLDEFFVLAKSYPENSKESDEVINAAVKYYPKDATANLNAANVAMKEGRLQDAGAMLDKAGESFEAIYARGVYNALLGRYDKSLEFFNVVKDSIPAAGKAAATVGNIITITELLK